jgi:hypothetical protein
LIEASSFPSDATTDSLMTCIVILLIRPAGTLQTAALVHEAHVYLHHSFRGQFLNEPATPSSTRNSSSRSSVNRNPIGHCFGHCGPGQAGKDGAHEIVDMVEGTTNYSSLNWKNHAMYFLPLTKCAGSANDPDYILDKYQAMYARISR